MLGIGVSSSVLSCGLVSAVTLTLVLFELNDPVVGPDKKFTPQVSSAINGDLAVFASARTDLN